MATPKDKNEAIAPTALDLALALVIKNCREEWEAELRRMSAESRALIAELKATIAELRVADAESKATATKAKARP